MRAAAPIPENTVPISKRDSHFTNFTSSKYTKHDYFFWTQNMPCSRTCCRHLDQGWIITFGSLFEFGPEVGVL